MGWDSLYSTQRYFLVVQKDKHLPNLKIVSYGRAWIETLVWQDHLLLWEFYNLVQKDYLVLFPHFLATPLHLNQPPPVLGPFRKWYGVFFCCCYVDDLEKEIESFI